MLKVMAMLTLSHIIGEDENNKLIDNTGTEQLTVKLID